MNYPATKIIKAGAIVGTLDILSASLYYYIKTKNNPFNILKFVASGFFGKAAFSGGDTMIIAGLIFHYIIAFSFTFFFFWLFPKLKLFTRNTIGMGVVYGIFMWVVMNLVVVPLSNIPSRPFDITNALINAFILIVAIGIPLAVMAKGAYKM